MHPNPSQATAPAAGTDFRVNAPGRVNLIGEHTDYNRGWVLPMAVERGIQMRVRRRSDRQAHLNSQTESAPVRVDLSGPIRPGGVPWGRYVEGVLAGYQELGWEIPGFEASISADLPAGGGLSSSAALELATAKAIETLCQKALSPIERALLCQRAEHEFAGVPCGIMDQFAISFARAGEALLLDCHSLQMTPVELNSDSLLLLVVNSGVKHALADGEYAKRRAECEEAARLLEVDSLRDVSSLLWQTKAASLPEPLRKRVAHVISENTRTLAFVSALGASDWKTAGSLMYASHASLANDYQVSCPELDTLVRLARTVPGVYGCRMTGGGFGGCVVALVDKAQATEAWETFARKYQKATGILPACFLTHAAAGPTVTPLD
jgi:galactokinase